MTREEVITWRKNGIKYWDDALLHKTREVLIKEAVENFELMKSVNFEKFPKMYEGSAGWYQLMESFKTIIKNTLELKGSPQQTWNLDEILTKSELIEIMNKLKFEKYVQIHKRTS
jgi:hypothetical protein